jgi:hypothetical protein
MAFKFYNFTKHGKLGFPPNTPLDFEDPDAIPYFKACGWGEESNESPAHTYSKGEIDIDPETVHRDTGFLVSDIINNGGTPQDAIAAGMKPNGPTPLAVSDIGSGAKVDG